MNTQTFKNKAELIAAMYGPEFASPMFNSANLFASAVATLRKDGFNVKQDGSKVIVSIET